MKNNEVSDTGEVWIEYAPPPSRSRWRVVAVMSAVVIGCGAAAFLVTTGSAVQHNAQQIDQIGIIEMPQRTSGIAGADATPEPVPTKGPEGAGRGAAPPASTTEETPTTESSVEVTPTTVETSTPSTTSHQADPTSSSPKHTSTPTRTSTSKPKPTCLLWIICTS